MTSITIVFAIYIAILILIGWFASRGESEEGFMLAERKVEGFQVAATMSAGFFDGAVLAIYIAYVYQYGLSAVWFFVGIALGFLVLKKYAGRIKRLGDQLGVYSMPEYFFRILGKRNGLVFSTALIIQFFILLAVNLIVSGKVLSIIFPISYPLAVAVGGFIILTYLLLAGFKAVIKTDYFQLIIMFLMSTLAAVAFLRQTSIPAEALNLGAAGGVNILSFLILGVVAIMVAPDLWQRIFATKDEENMRRGLNYGAIILPLLGTVICAVGIATKQFFPAIAPEDALITGFSHLLPALLYPFGMVLLYAVTLSSADTMTFVISSIITRDLKNYTKKWGERSMRTLTRFFMVAFVLLAIILGILNQNVLALGLSTGSLYLLLFPVVFGSLYWRLNESAVFWSLVISIASALVLLVLGLMDLQMAIVPLPIALVSLILLQVFFNWRAHDRILERI